jgi:cytochrome P450
MNEPAAGDLAVGDDAPDATNREVNFTPLDPELAADFWPRINALREKCPVAYSTAHWNADDTGFWLLNKHEDVMAAATDWRTYSSAEGASPVQFDLDIMRMVPLETDPPLHRGIRKLLNPFFAPEVLQESEGVIRSAVDGLIDKCLTQSPVDFVAMFTSQLPPIVFFENFLDQKVSELGWVMEALDMLMRDPDRALEAAPRLLMFCQELLQSRAAEGRTDDLAGTIAHMGTGRFDDGLELDERARVETLMLTVMAGMETTMGGLASISRILAERPDLREGLRGAEPKKLDRAVEEFLRFETPVTTAGRTLTQDVEVRGCPMKAGERVTLNWSAANRDPDKFPNPDTIDIDRENVSAHVAFGGGVHRCLGNHLARREIKAAVQAICELTTFELAEPGFVPEYRPSFARGAVSLPIRLAR